MSDQQGAAVDGGNAAAVWCGHLSKGSPGLSTWPRSWFRKHEGKRGMRRDRTKRSSVIEAIQGHLEARPEDLVASLHGSFEQGAPHRDIDVAVWVDPGRSPDRGWRRYELHLSVAIHLSMGEAVGVRVLNHAPAAFRYCEQHLVSVGRYLKADLG